MSVKGSYSPWGANAQVHILSDHNGRGTSLLTREPPACRSSEPVVTACQRLAATTDSSLEALVARRQRLEAAGYQIEQISGTGPEIDPVELQGSIEGFLGFARVPLGVAGPVHIKGVAAQGDFFVPFATSEGTLVASFQHAFNAMNRCGGVSAICGDEQVGRAPCFEFANLPEAGVFSHWLP